VNAVMNPQGPLGVVVCCCERGYEPAGTYGAVVCCYERGDEPSGYIVCSSVLL